MEWLRERKVIRPALATLESVVRSVRSKVERDVYWRLFGRLAESHKKALNKLLELGPARGSLLGWLRRVPQSCSVAGILDLMHRLSWVRGTGFPRELADGIASHRVDRLAARGSRHSLGHFRRFPPEKRYTILACFLLYVAEELTDRSIDFHRRLIGRMFRESEKKRWVGFVQQGPSVNEKLQNYSRLTTIIGRARKEGRNLELAIEKEFGWDVLELDGQESERLARPLNGSDFQDFRAQFPHFRRYTPLFIETFQFEGIPTQKPLLRALDTLREAHHTLKRAIRFYRRGSVNDRTQLDQDLNAMALNLVVAAIILWNTAYLDRAIQVLSEEGISVPEEYLAHISPLGWEHITITGTYHWKGVVGLGDGSNHSAAAPSSFSGQRSLSGVFLPSGPVWPTWGRPRKAHLLAELPALL